MCPIDEKMMVARSNPFHRLIGVMIVETTT